MSGAALGSELHCDDHSSRARPLRSPLSALARRPNGGGRPIGRGALSGSGARLLRDCPNCLQTATSADLGLFAQLGDWDPSSVKPAGVQGFSATERRWNRTIQAWGCHALPVLKTGWATRPLPLQEPNLVRPDGRTGGS
jgi:hypothetical protein